MARYDDKKQVKCSFCGKTQDQVNRIVAGPGVYICNECIELCSEIIEEEFEDARVEQQLDEVLKPQEIKKILMNMLSVRRNPSDPGCCGL